MRLVSLKIFCHKLQTNILEEMPTTPAPTCDPLIPHKEHPTNCTIFYHCEVGLDGPKYVEKSCGPTMYFNPISMVCDWPYAVEEIKPVCKGTSTTIQELPVEETISRGDVAPVEAELKYEPLCPPGTEEHDCAIQCDRLCIYYFHVVREKGLCENEKKCERDCVEKGQSLTCPEGKMWANNHTCVDLSHCLCRSEDGKPIKVPTDFFIL
jgi:von Willebrand factor